MIKKSLLIFAFALLLHIIIRDFVRPDIEITQVPWQANQQIGQRFLYSTQNIEDLVVGSSMSFHLDFSGTRDSITNISFTGESAHKGLQLILERGKMCGIYPQRVYIEMNTLSTYKQSVFDDIIYNPFLKLPRKYIPSLRDGKQPLPWVATIMEKNITPLIIPNKLSLLENYLMWTSNENEQDNKTAKGDIVPNERLKDSDIPMEDELNIEKMLVNNINKLIEKGCEPIFYELPIREQYKASKRHKTLRAIIERNYPATEYSYIGYPIDSNFQTHDGFHLTAKDSPRYSSYLRSMIDSLSCRREIK